MVLTSLRMARRVLWMLLTASVVHASVIGHNEPALPLTADRILTLPPAQRTPWTAYLERSQAQWAADHDALAAERAGLATISAQPAEGHSARSMPLDRPAAWYATLEARHIADVIVSFQTPAGGWGKNMDMAGPPRARGQMYVPLNLSPVAPAAGDFDAPQHEAWHYIGTLDNDATTTELHFLAQVQAATPAAQGELYRASILRGLRYLLAAQYPNGGWPQVWPLEGGYHDAITFNDDAVANVMDLLRAVSAGKLDFAFVPGDLRRASGLAADRALDCILRAQVVIDEHPTIWGQQHDPLTLLPVGARNFEPPSLATGESARLLDLLMGLPAPTPAVRAAITAGVAWLAAHALHDIAFVGDRSTPAGPGTPAGRHLEWRPGAGPLWARYYSLRTGKPMFGDRDKTIHDDVNEISLERRNGYGWYGTGPSHTLARYATWRAAMQAHPDQTNALPPKKEQ